MRGIKIGAFISMLLMTPVLEAQNLKPSLWEETLEELSTENETEKNWEDKLEELNKKLEEPLNINTATKNEYEHFPFLTDLQIENLLAYVYIHGPMQTIYELQLVEGMDKRTIEWLLPFVCVKPVKKKTKYPSLKKVLKYGKHEMLARTDFPFYTRKGYQKKYLGPSIYHSLRYNFHYSTYFQAGITAEKDGGEPFLALHNMKGYDFYSPYFLLQNYGRLKALALGNYRVSFGQGLVLGSNFCLGKTFSLLTSEYRTEGIRKHSSSDEYHYFSGAGTTVKILSSFYLSGFYSHRLLDGGVEGENITSISKTGLHRTQKEADKINACKLQLTGGHVTYEKNRLRVGITGIYYFFNHPYEPDLREYARYNLHGNHFYNFSVDYNYRTGRFSWAGEAAKGKQGYALLNRLKYSLSPDYNFLLIHRYYSYDYWAMFGHSFGEGSTPQNENGWYLAMEAQPLAHWRFFGSLDFFSFPWWRYRISKPSQGVEIRLQTTCSLGENCSMYLNYRYTQKERDISGTEGKIVLPVIHHRFRYRLNYRYNAWNFRTTIDYNNFRQKDRGYYRFKSQQGWGCTQSCAYVFQKFPLMFSLQGSYFCTDDYDSRIYTSEKGLLYTFYTPSFYGKGFRYSALLRYDWDKTFMFLVKFAQTVYQDRTCIGSGNDLIDGNRKSDLQIQFRMKL